MDKGIIVHRLSLNMEDQRVQATITLAQGDTATHRLVVDLRHGTEIVEFEPGTSAVLCVQNPSVGVDVLGDVTVYGQSGVYRNCLVCDINPAVTSAVGMHEACFVLYTAPGGAFSSLNTPKIAFVVRADLMASSNLQLEGNEAYAAIARAQIAAEEASEKAIAAKNDAEDEVSVIKNATARVEMEDCDYPPQVLLSKKIDEAGKEYISFDFVLPRGATGERGATGQGFQIVKSFSSVAEMNEAFRNGTDGVNIGEFVLIDMGETPHEPNSEHGDLYVKTSAGFERKGDLEGAPGIKGETGYTPEFKVVDGQCYVKRRADGEYELFGVDVVTLAENFSVGDATALTKGSVAMGDGSVAGTRGFGVKSFDYANKQIKLALESPVTGVYAAPAYAEGDMFSILNGSHYAFCGKIESVSVSGNTATITYTPTTTHGTVDSRSDPWWVYDPRTVLYSIRAIFWVPEKPLVGYDLEYEGEEAFPNAKALGGGYASAKGAIVTAPDSAAGGSYAAIFGPMIRAGYGTISSGRENFSTGLHSALFGRYLYNYGDYNFLACAQNEIKRGKYLGILGYGNVFENGNASFMASYNSRLAGTYTDVFGSNHTVYGDQDLVGGNAHKIGTSPTAYKCHYSVIGGRTHKIAQSTTVRDVAVFGEDHTINHSGVLAAGNGHKSSSDYQTLLGLKSTPDSDAALILAYNGNIFTVGRSGPRSSVGTDAVTVAYLNSQLSVLRTSMESALINGKW